MLILKDAEKHKVKVAAKPEAVKPPEQPKAPMLDMKMISGVLEIMAKNLERLGEIKPVTEITVSAPPVREYVIKHIADKDGRITESIITVKT